MAAPTLIVNVVVTKSTRTVSLAAFNVPAIFGPSNRFTDIYRLYNSTAGMIADGFLLSDPEYIAAVALLSQAIKPASFVVSKFTAAVAQSDTFQIATLTTGHVYQLTINSTIISYTALISDTQQSILAALLAAIGTAFPTNPPMSGAVVGTGAAATLTLTSPTSGAGISYTAIDSLITHVATVANHSIANDIIAAQNAVLPSQMFYGVIVTSHAASDILQVATYVESQLLVYVAATLDAGCLTGSTTDIMSVLHALTFDRTMLLYSAQANTNAPDAAWMGYMLPTLPGTGNWAMKTLRGVTPDNLTPTQISNVIAKKGNVYINIGGNGTTLYGTAAGGEYFDVTIFIDFLASLVQSLVIAVVTDPLNLKVPYTNQGISMIAAPIRAAFKQGQDQQGIVPGWKVFAPDIADVSKADRSGRVLNNIGGTATLAGAINQINVNVFVST